MQIGFPSPVLLYSCGAQGPQRTSCLSRAAGQGLGIFMGGQSSSSPSLENTGEQPKAKIDVCVESPETLPVLEFFPIPPNT